MLDVETLREQHELLLRCSRQHVRGVAAGAAFLGLAGGAWAITALMQLPVNLPWADGLVAGAGFMLAIIGAWCAGRAMRLPLLVLPTRSTRRGFALVVVALSFAIVATSVMLSQGGHAALVPVVATLLVGLHFLPLACLFHLSSYRQTGLWLIALALSTWAFVPHTLATGAVALPLWPLVIGLGGAVIFWATAAWNLARLAPLLVDAAHGPQ